MELAFPWPYSQGEWLAWSSALVTVLLGLAALFAPRTVLRLLRLEPRADRPGGLAAARASLSGFHIGVGLACILLAQPLLYLALGLGWAVTAFGRLVSTMSDGGNGPYNWIALVVELALAVPAVLFGFGLIS